MVNISLSSSVETAANAPSDAVEENIMASNQWTIATNYIIVCSCSCRNSLRGIVMILIMWVVREIIVFFPSLLPLPYLIIDAICRGRWREQQTKGKQLLFCGDGGELRNDKSTLRKIQRIVTERANRGNTATKNSASSFSQQLHLQCVFISLHCSSLRSYSVSDSGSVFICWDLAAAMFFMLLE